MKAMRWALNFGESAGGNGWGASARLLECKLDEKGKRLIKIGGWLPSSKARSASGAKKDGPPLPERTRACGCGNNLDRGINAATNIKNEALRMLQAS
ncbi:MAG: transposase [Clostridiales bacterium]|nr:transposase [Clostridiales bacterium]